MLPNSEWLITTVSSPVKFNRGTEETWFLNPVRRYVLNAEHVAKIMKHVETVSTLSGSPYYKPLLAGRALNGKRVLVERFRDRGLGDLLFLTGPLAFMHSITGGEVQFHVYAFSDRGQALLNSPYLEHGTVFVGPNHYNDFQDYDYQWMVNSVTETSQERDQLNVYDALYAQLGLNPEQVDPKFKRPFIEVAPGELRDLHAFYHTVWSERQFDVRRTGYYVIAPLTHSPLRCAPYRMWLDLAVELSRSRPVFIVGQTNMPLPDLDMAAGEFVTKSQELGHQVVSLLGQQISVRSLVTLISQATAFVGLDSGPLYIAQGCRVPAVSLWGPHDPGVRIGYDPDYMDLAVWNEQFCTHAPCYAYGGFPIRKCPDGASQTVCHPLKGTSVEDVLEKVEQVESKRVYKVIFKHETPSTTDDTTP